MSFETAVTANICALFISSTGGTTPLSIILVSTSSGKSAVTLPALGVLYQFELAEWHLHRALPFDCIGGDISDISVRWCRHLGRYIRRHSSDVYLGMSLIQMVAPIWCISIRRQNWRNGSKLEQFKAMDRLISRCKLRQCSQMQPGVHMREKCRSRCYPISHYHILIFLLPTEHRTQDTYRSQSYMRMRGSIWTSRNSNQEAVPKHPQLLGLYLNPDAFIIPLGGASWSHSRT